jgi:hypothetical protein
VPPYSSISISARDRARSHHRIPRPSAVQLDLDLVIDLDFGRRPHEAAIASPDPPPYSSVSIS